MPSLPLEIPAGIVRTKSANAAKGRYTDGDKVRFINGLPEKWAGWNMLIDEAMLGKARGATAWSNVNGDTNAAFGTNLKLYALTGNDTLTDITPIRATGTLGTDPFAVVDGSPIVTVTDTAHGADDGDFVVFGDATAGGGITIDGEYQLTRIDDDHYTIVHSAPATSTDSTTGGAAVTYQYQINTGLADGVVGLGWGAGTWGTGTWGTPRAEGIPLDLRVWSLAEYGNELLASPSGGSLYLWEQATDARAELVTNAPASIRAMFVTGERFPFALGTTTPMTVQWPDRDDITDWTPGAADTANIRVLQQGSKLMGGTPLTDGYNLVWSDTALYIFQYTGTDFVYDDRLAGTGCGLAAPHAFAKVSGSVYWMSSPGEFYRYANGVQGIPNSIDISDYIFRDMDPAQVTKTWCVYDQKYNQVRWGYCSVGATEPDKYVDVSLDDFSWTVGTLDRTTGTLFRPSDVSLLMVDHDGFIISHGEGLDADGVALESFIRFGSYAMAGGDENLDVMGIIPDCERHAGALSFEIETKERPNSAAVLDSSTTSMLPGDEIADIRVSGRHINSMTVRSNVMGGDYRLGIVSLEVQASGQRR